MMTNAYKVNAFINDIQAYSEDALSVMIKDNNVIDVKKLSGLIDCKINGSEEENIKRENQKVVYYAKKLIESKNNLIKSSCTFKF